MNKEVLTNALNDILIDIAAATPDVFTRLLAFFVALYEQNQGSQVGSTEIKAKGPLDVSKEDGSGKHELTAEGIPDEVMAALRGQIAEGQVREKAGQWLAGLITGLTIKGF